MISVRLDSSKYKIGFTSDQHHYHHSIIRLSNRPFKDVMEMNETMRDNHNRIFSKDDFIFNLGDTLLLPRVTDPIFSKEQEDIAFEFLKTYKGTIFYVPGNHESNIERIKKIWNVLLPLTEVTVKEPNKESAQKIILCHYALRTWHHAYNGTWHLYGHSHGGLLDDNDKFMQDRGDTLAIDVGVDTNNFTPYTFDQVKGIMDSRILNVERHFSRNRPKKEITHV